MSLGHTIRLHYRVTHYIYRCTNSYTVLQQLILKFFLFSSIFLNFLQISFYFVFPFLFLAIAKISLKRKKSFKVETLIAGTATHARNPAPHLTLTSLKESGKPESTTPGIRLETLVLQSCGTDPTKSKPLQAIRPTIHRNNYINRDN